MPLVYDDISTTISGVESSFIQNEQLQAQSLSKKKEQETHQHNHQLVSIVSTSIPTSLTETTLLKSTDIKSVIPASTSSSIACENGSKFMDSSILCSKLNKSVSASSELKVSVTETLPITTSITTTESNNITNFYNTTLLDCTAPNAIDLNQIATVHNNTKSLASSHASEIVFSNNVISDVDIVSCKTNKPASITGKNPLNNGAASNCDSIQPSSAQQLLNGLVASNINSQNSTHPQMMSEDPRAFQLALELSMVGLNETGTAISSARTSNPSPNIHSIQQMHNLQNIHDRQDSHIIQQEAHRQQARQQQSQGPFDIKLNTFNNLLNAVVAAANGSSTSSNIEQLSKMNCFSQFANLAGNTGHSSNILQTNVEDRSKKSQNMTECVPVPSSEHVAEIVGRQGCKIKALRAKTNTYIKTPVRGEEPVFVVTGRKEDVAKAKCEILSAAEHFSLIRATRRPMSDVCIDGGSVSVANSNICSSGFGFSDSENSNKNGLSEVNSNVCGRSQITIQVRVPYRVVGLVVGPKGATIKHIQQETKTYIVTPSRDKQPIFEVTGLPDNVQLARKQIEAHIASRTGYLQMSSSGIVDQDQPTVQTLTAISQMLKEDINSDILLSIYKNGINSAFDCVESTNESPVNSNTEISSSNGINLNMRHGNHGENPTTLTNKTMPNQVLMNIMTNSMQQPQVHNQNNGYHSHTLNNSSIDTGNGLNQTSQKQKQLHLMMHSSSNQHNVDVNNLIRLNPPPSPINVGGQLNSLNLTTSGNISMSGNNSNSASGPLARVNGMTRSCSSASSSSSSKSTNNSGGSASTNSSRPELVNIWKNLGDSLDVDEGIGESPSIWTLPSTLNPINATHCSPTSTSISPTDSLLSEIAIAAAVSGGNTALGNNSLSHLITTMSSTSQSRDTMASTLLQHQQLAVLQSSSNMNLTAIGGNIVSSGTSI